MTCFTGFFHHPEYPTLDESLLRLAGGGAVATWSPSGLGVDAGHDYLLEGFYRAVFTDDQTFDIASGGTGGVTFNLPATLAPGDYVIHGWVASQGASAEAFADTFQVGAPGPQLMYQVTPVGPVHPGDILTYTVQFTNTLDSPLSGAVITASLPVSATVLPASITGGGVVNHDEMAWDLGAVGTDQAVEASFAVQVNEGADQLLSVPRLTADEIAPTWGPSAWNPVRTPTGIQFSWTDVGGTVDHYEVWRSSTPYFTPGDAGTEHIADVAPASGGAVIFTDTTSHIGNPDVNDYYIVLAIDANGDASPLSEHVGGFDFALTPGQ